MMRRSSRIIAILILMMFHHSASAQTTSSLASCGNAFSGLLDEWRAAAFALPSKPGQAVVSIASGSGAFIKGDERKAFAQHDVIFVEAGTDHRFVDCSADFSAWVIFWGPEGGESSGV